MQVAATNSVWTNPWNSARDRDSGSVGALLSATSTPQDELSLSDAGQAAAEGAAPIFDPNQAPNLFAMDFSDVPSRVQAALKSHGIETSSPLALQTGADGWPTVAGNHPQKAEIEAIFRQDRELRDDFVGKQAQEEIKRAGEEALQFQEAYRRDPEGAVQRFSYLFGPRHEEYSLVFQGDSAVVRFD